MKQFNDTQLNALINEAKEATSRLSSLRLKKESCQAKELLVFRRNHIGLIRKRATELRLTESDFNTIHLYVINNNF